MKRKGNATLSRALDVVRYLIRCPFEKTSRRDTLEKSRTSAPFLHHNTHESRDKKKNETFSLLSSLSHLFELLLLRSRFPSRLFPRGVRVGGCVFLFVRRTVCATPHNEVSHPFGSASERHHHHTAQGKKSPRR